MEFMLTERLSADNSRERYGIEMFMCPCANMHSHLTYDKSEYN